jgi:hypothetical protein
MAQDSTAGKPLPEAGGFTYGDYKAWELAGGERYELIYGEAFAMPAQSAYHQSILGELFKQIAVYLTGKPCKAYPGPMMRGCFMRKAMGITRWLSRILRWCAAKKSGGKGLPGSAGLCGGNPVSLKYRGGDAPEI